MRTTLKLLFFSFLILSLVHSETSRKKKPVRPEQVPIKVWKASNFITEFHKKKFVEGVFHRINQAYLTSVTDDDIPEMNVVNALASVITSELMEKRRSDLMKNNTFSHFNQSEAQVEENKEKMEKFYANCEPYDYTGSPVVELLNLTRFDEILTIKQNISSRSVPAPCVFALFYAHTCPFSAMIAPHFNALARAFPSIKMVAINTKKHQIVNSQFGIVGIPSAILFHNGRRMRKFSRQHHTLAMLSKFLTQYTGIVANPNFALMSTDFGGPLPGIPKQETDYNLPLSFSVIAVWFIKYMIDSGWFATIYLTLRDRKKIGKLFGVFLAILSIILSMYSVYKVSYRYWQLDS